MRCQEEPGSAKEATGFQTGLVLGPGVAGRVAPDGPSTPRAYRPHFSPPVPDLVGRPCDAKVVISKACAYAMQSRKQDAYEGTPSCKGGTYCVRAACCKGPQKGAVRSQAQPRTSVTISVRGRTASDQSGFFTGTELAVDVVSDMLLANTSVSRHGP